MKIFGLIINKASFGPYSHGWYGIKVHHGEDVLNKTSNRYWAQIILSLGKKKGWDGYQNSKICRVYGLNLKWGESIECEYDEGEIGDEEEL